MTSIITKTRRFWVFAIFHRTHEVPKSHGNRRAKKGDPASRTVAKIIDRCEKENAAEATRVMRAIPALTATQPLPVFLLRCGDPQVVHGILGGRGIDERMVEQFDHQGCEWCPSEAPASVPVQPTSVRITGDREYTECCTQPCCFHAALTWVDDADDSGDTDVVVEIAKRPAVIL